jgi:polyisoprenoid-binding protein YceI
MEHAVNKVKVRTVEQPLHRLLLPAAALALGAAVVVGTGAVRAQEEAASADGIDGAWAVDTSIGDFAEFTSSWVGFRVAEVLSPGGEVEAVGRTPLVSGGLEASGTIIENAVIEADLTGIVSDRSRRDPAIQRALETGDFPTAIFESTAAVDLGEVPADNVPFSASVPGTLTIRDVSQEVTLELDGQRVGDVVVVVGTLPVDFTSFGVTMPTAPIVVSVEDSGDLEWQLFLTREPAMADDGSGDDMAADADATAADEDGTASDDMTEDAPAHE